MSRKLVGRLQDAAEWVASDASGQPTNAIAVVASADERLGGPVGALVAEAPVVGDRVEAAVTTLDLRSFDDLELWVRADRPADGSDRAPWYLEVRLGAVNRPVGANSNRWQRFLPIRADGRWEVVVVSLGDLPLAVRQAVNAVRFTCLDASRPFRCAIDGPWAVRAAAIGDVDDALRSLLDGRLTLDGAAVPLAFDPGAAAAPRPALLARQVSARLRPDLPAGTELRTDFTGPGFALRPAAVPLEVGYELRPDAATRAEQAAILEFALTALATRTTLEVAGRPAAVQFVEPRPDVEDLPVLTISVVTSLRPAAPARPAVPPFNQIDVEVDDLANA